MSAPTPVAVTPTPGQLREQIVEDLLARDDATHAGRASDAELFGRHADATITLLWRATGQDPARIREEMGTRVAAAHAARAAVRPTGLAGLLRSITGR